MTIWRMRIACWIPKPTNTHSQYLTLIALQQQRLHERASVLRSTYTDRPVERQVSNAMYVSINRQLNSPLSFRRTLTSYFSSARERFERRFLSSNISASNLKRFRVQNATRKQRVERACRNQHNG
jgi:hypothetical protein